MHQGTPSHIESVFSDDEYPQNHERQCRARGGRYDITDSVHNTLYGYNVYTWAASPLYHRSHHGPKRCVPPIKLIGVELLGEEFDGSTPNRPYVFWSTLT